MVVGIVAVRTKEAASTICASMFLYQWAYPARDGPSLTVRILTPRANLYRIVYRVVVPDFGFAGGYLLFRWCSI